jgi:predicted phage terminase large subunit-like protein
MQITKNGKEFVLKYLDWQLEVFFSIFQYIIAACGRRSGKTNGAANYAIEQVLLGKKVLWVDTTQSNLDKYFDRYFRPVLNQIKLQFWKYRKQGKELVTDWGLIDFRSAERPENIEGFAYDLIIINEAGIVLKGAKGRALWYNSILPMMLDYNPRIMFVGTPKGKRADKTEPNEEYTLYYELAQKGDSEQFPKWKHYNFSYKDNPLLSQDAIEELESEYPAAIRAQELDGKFVDIGDEDVFKSSWFQIVDTLPDKSLWEDCIISWDTAFRDHKENDDSAATVWVQTRNAYYLVDCICKKFQYPDLVRTAKELYKRYSEDVSYNLIEDKASGLTIIDTFKRETRIPVKPIVPKGDKFSRAVACTPAFENKKVFFLRAQWNNMVINQLTSFSILMDTPDDIVDSVSQALNYLKKSTRGEIITKKKKMKRSNILRGYHA